MLMKIALALIISILTCPALAQSKEVKRGDRIALPAGALLYKDTAAIRESVLAIELGDEHAIKEILESGRAFKVEDGTRILVLDLAAVKVYEDEPHPYGYIIVAKVRVLSGERRGVAGWIPKSMLE